MLTSFKARSLLQRASYLQHTQQAGFNPGVQMLRCFGTSDGLGPKAFNFQQMIDTNDIYHIDLNQEKKEAPIYRICLTGGPCAGKTTAIAKVQNMV